MIYSNSGMRTLSNILQALQAIEPYLAELLDDEHGRKKKRRRTNILYDRSRANALAKILSFPAWQFKRMFRVDLPTFYQIVERRIRPALGKNEEMAKRNKREGKGEVISVEIMLMATLRYLAGGMMWDIVCALDVAPGSFYTVIWQTMEAIDNAYEITFSLAPEDLERSAQEFAAINRSSAEQFYGCVMAIDGWVVQTRKPTAVEIYFLELQFFRIRQ
eukprot:gene23551-28561_t